MTCLQRTKFKASDGAVAFFLACFCGGGLVDFEACCGAAPVWAEALERASAPQPLVRIQPSGHSLCKYTNSGLQYWLRYHDVRRKLRLIGQVYKLV